MSTRINCSGKDCTSVVITSELVSPNATYTCKSHTKPNQDDERFQKAQFDPDLRRSGSPVGTSHIHNQGSDVLTSEELLPRCRHCSALISKEGECECEEA